MLESLPFTAVTSDKLDTARCMDGDLTLCKPCAESTQSLCVFGVEVLIDRLRLNCDSRLASASDGCRRKQPAMGSRS